MNRASVWSLYLIIILADLGVGITGPILPDIRVQFGISAVQVGLVATGYSIGRLLLAMPAGIAMATVSPLRILLLGTVGLAAGSVIAFLAPTFEVLLLARGVSGAGSSLCMIAAVTLLTESTSVANRGRVLSGYQAAIIVGMSVGPMLGGSAASLWGWRSSFAVSAVASLALLVGIALLRQRPGSFLTAKRSEDRAEEGGSAPLARVLLRPPVILANAASLAMFFGMAGLVGTIVPIFGGEVIGLGAGAIGLITGTVTFIRFGTNMLGGAVSDRYGRLAVLVPGYGIMAVGSLSFCLVGDQLGFVLAVTLLATGRFGNAVPLTLMIDHTPASLRSRMIGVNRVIGDAGRMVGPLALGWLVDTYSYNAAFIFVAALMALIMVAGLLLGWRMGKRRLATDRDGLAPA